MIDRILPHYVLSVGFQDGRPKLDSALRRRGWGVAFD
jgi:hypothetical protein